MTPQIPDTTDIERAIARANRRIAELAQPKKPTRDYLSELKAVVAAECRSQAAF